MLLNAINRDYIPVSLGIDIELCVSCLMTGGNEAGDKKDQPIKYGCVIKRAGEECRWLERLRGFG